MSDSNVEIIDLTSEAEIVMDETEADFSLGTLDLSSVADFSMDLDLSYSDDDEEQIGGRHEFRIQLVQERHIEKFQVHGYDYDVHVDAFDRNIEFTLAVQMLHGILAGRPFSISTSPSSLYFIFSF